MVVCYINMVVKMYHFWNTNVEVSEKKVNFLLSLKRLVFILEAQFMPNIPHNLKSRCWIMQSSDGDLGVPSLFPIKLFTPITFYKYYLDGSWNKHVYLFFHTMHHFRNTCNIVWQLYNISRSRFGDIKNNYFFRIETLYLKNGTCL